MKAIILLLFLLALSSAISQWQPAGNTEKLFVDHNGVNDFSISPDNKHIYTLHPSELIKVWDMQTGDSINAIQAVNLPKYFFDRKYFLSSDGQSYCAIYKEQILGGVVAAIFIYDIATNQIVDSARTEFNYIVYNNWENRFGISLIDYYRANKELLYGIQLNRSNIPTHEVITTGKIGWLSREDSGWRKKYISEVCPGFLVWKPQADGLLLENEYRYINENDRHYTRRYELIRPEHGNNSLLTEYKTFRNNDGSLGSSGLNISFTSAIITNDDNDIILVSKDSMQKYSINSSGYVYGEKCPDSVLGRKTLYNSGDSRYLYLHGESNKLLICHAGYLNSSRLVEIAEIDTISMFKNSHDFKYVFLTDGKSSIYRIKTEDIFRLKASFHVKETKVRIGDSVEFYDCSLGDPDSYMWDFGDGNTSTDINPKHAYTDTGYYNIKLIVRKNTESDTLIYDDIISVKSGTSVTDTPFPVTPVSDESPICITLFKESLVKLSIYNLEGRLVDIMEKEYEAGAYTIVPDPGNISGGIYIYVLEYEGKRITRKVSCFR